MNLSQKENLQTLYCDEHLIIKHSPESTVMHCYWNGFIAARRIQELGAVVIRLVREKGVSRVLNSNRGVIGPWSSIAPWVIQSWFPEMFSAGLKYFAWVMPEDSFALISARDAMPNLQSVKAFDLEAEALRWLSDPDRTFPLEKPVDASQLQRRALYGYLCSSINRYDPVAAAVLQAELTQEAGQAVLLPARPRSTRPKSKKA